MAHLSREPPFHAIIARSFAWQRAGIGLENYSKTRNQHPETGFIRGALNCAALTWFENEQTPMDGSIIVSRVSGCSKPGE